MIPVISVGALLKSSPLCRLDTRILLMHALGISRMQLITESERLLTEDEAARVTALMHKRHAGEPIAYIVGSREFYGLPFHVSPDVLIPRPETELLVDLALAHLPHNGRVLDMGTGSGAIAVSIARERTDATVTALDLSQAALAIARRNAERHRVAIDLVHSNWFAALGKRQFDLIAANPPYIAGNDPHLAQGDLRFEPADALTDRADGLSALRAIIGGSRAHLIDGGRVLVEHGHDQAGAVRQLIGANGFTEVRSWKDLAGIERVSGGVKH